MSTSDRGPVNPPVSAAELEVLANQLYAARPGPDSPPQTTAVAPRGGVPDPSGLLPPGLADLSAFAVPSGIVPT
ncbi:MAG: cysteine desulfurase, partial [Mycobacterium sp.]